MAKNKRQIIRWLREVRGRLLFVRAVEAGLRVALAASAAAVVILALGWAGFQSIKTLFPMPHQVLLLLPAGWLIGFLLRLLAGISLSSAASFADQRRNLKERLVTALETAEENLQGVAELQLKDTEAKLQDFPPGKLKYSRTLIKRSKLLAACALAIAALAFIPRPEYRPTAEPTLGKAAEQITNATRGIEKLAAKPKDVEQSIQRARDLAEQVKAGAIGPHEAAEKVRQIADDLKKLAENADAALEIEKTLQEQSAMRDFVAAASEGPDSSSAAAKDLAERFSTPPPEGLSPDERAAFIKQINEALDKAERLGEGPLKAALDGIRQAIGDAKLEHIRADALGESLETLAQLLAASKQSKEAQDAIVGTSVALSQAAAILDESETAPPTGAFVVGKTPIESQPPETSQEMPPSDTTSWNIARKRAETLIEQEEVRPEHREIVRKYFTR